eukprot:15450741-Alexandrium_andersonii.AAC.1
MALLFGSSALSPVAPFGHRVFRSSATWLLRRRPGHTKDTRRSLPLYCHAVAQLLPPSSDADLAVESDGFGDESFQAGCRDACC